MLKVGKLVLEKENVNKMFPEKYKQQSEKLNMQMNKLKNICLVLFFIWNSKHKLNVKNFTNIKYDEFKTYVFDQLILCIWYDNFFLNYVNDFN